MRIILLVSAALASVGYSKTLVVHEKRIAAPPAWKHSHRLPATSVLPMRIGLAQANLHTLEDLLMEVSHPESASYGKHWSASQVAKHFAPTDETIDAVRGWLTEEGIHPDRINLSVAKNWIEFNATAEEAEALLRAEYQVYRHHQTGHVHVACDSYSIPQHMQPHIDIITPTVHFDKRVPMPKPSVSLRKRGNAPIPGANRQVGQPGAGNPPKMVSPNFDIKDFFNDVANCSSVITPICLRALYDFVYKPVETKKNSYGIVEYTPQAFVPSDLDMFFEMFATNLVGVRPNLISIDGGTAQQNMTGFDFNGESDLDLQYSMTLVDPQPITLLQTGDIPEGASFNNLLDAVDGSYCTFEGGDDPTEDGIYPDPLPGGFKGPESCGIIKPPNVISTSFASDEADATPFYNTRQCNEYGKLGLMGVSILYSSGDEGVAGNDNNCLNPDGTQTPNGTLFNPLFPAVCPFVTAVGATQILANHTVFEPESACEEVIFSGGGFSNVFARPSYQKAAVAEYLADHFPTNVAGKFNNSGSRGFPDISANGAFYAVAVDGEFELVFGTSCSSPVFGSMLTMINDARIAIGKGPVGFVNPTLYSDFFKGSFNDITIGGNQGCGTPGFESVPGWDPVTGLGTPKFDVMLAKWLLLP